MNKYWAGRVGETCWKIKIPKTFLLIVVDNLGY